MSNVKEKISYSYEKTITALCIFTYLGNNPCRLFAYKKLSLLLSLNMEGLFSENLKFHGGKVESPPIDCFSKF